MEYNIKYLANNKYVIIDNDMNGENMKAIIVGVEYYGMDYDF